MLLTSCGWRRNLQTFAGHRSIFVAGHHSIFVAGWRPFIGWVCGFALLWHFILFDLLTWITVNFFPQVTELPELSGTETLVTVLLSLLGLGAMRTAEKFGGKAR